MLRKAKKEKKKVLNRAQHSSSNNKNWECRTLFKPPDIQAAEQAALVLFILSLSLFHSVTLSRLHISTQTLSLSLFLLLILSLSRMTDKIDTQSETLFLSLSLSLSLSQSLSYSPTTITVRLFLNSFHPLVRLPSRLSFFLFLATSVSGAAATTTTAAAAAADFCKMQSFVRSIGRSCCS